MPDPDDFEMKAAIRYASAKTVSGIVEELQARFGPDRAWPWDMVKAEVAAQRTGCSRKKGYGSDGAIASFIADAPTSSLTRRSRRLARSTSRRNPFPPNRRFTASSSASLKRTAPDGLEP